MDHGGHIHYGHRHKSHIGQHVRDLRMVSVIATLAAIMLFPLTVGVVCGTISSLRAGVSTGTIWRDARHWYIAWIILAVLAWVG